MVSNSSELSSIGFFLFRHRYTWFPNQFCLWVSYSEERISVRVGREGGSPIMQDRFPQTSWYQDLGTKILIPIVILIVNLIGDLIVNLVVNTLSSKRLDAKRHYVILAKALDGIWQSVMAVWPNTQCLSADNIMSLGIKSSATESVGSKEFGKSADVAGSN